MSEENWTPPVAVVGEEVLFYPDGNVLTEPVVGRCIDVIGRCINLTVVFGRNATVQTHYDILHWKDPWNESKPTRRAQGCWQESPVRAQLASLSARLAKLEAALGETVEEELEEATA